ncbi:MAG: sigma 54-interacting transcriptional regulator [Firmicutes bacterium]|nr:sigma 54-interacting transcriptional regulator [Bacillota bacterium]MDH7496740.1 sigma 54-interacting transcriptional regulator [Bacillota bacterium]
MTGNEVVFIAPNRELEMVAREVVRELGEPITIELGVLAEGARIAKEAEERGAGAVISRGGTTVLIRKAGLSIPVIDVRVTGYDIMRALHRAKHYGNHVGIVGFSNIVRNVEDAEDILDIRVHKEQVSTPEEIAPALARLRDRKVKAVVGGTEVIKRAGDYGMAGVLLSSGKEAVFEAISEAKTVVSARRREIERAERLRAILSAVYSGVVAIDATGVVTLFNPSAERITGLRAGDVIGRHVTEVIPNTRLHLVLERREAELGQIQRLGHTTIITNRLPVVVNGEVIGVVASFEDVTKIQKLEETIRHELYARGHVAKYTFDDIVGRSKGIKEAIRRAKSFAEVASTIVIEAETGTGKEMFAQAIHLASPRRQGPFVAVNCAALPETLLESELFGYAPGAFTGAKQGGKPGLFEVAHGGTIFLDEIAETSVAVQARLLRVLQEKEVMRVGGYKVIPIDVRIIAATNRKLADLVAQGRFREDLFYRLDVLNLRIPPLRERREDIPLLVEHFLRSAASRMNKTVKGISTEAIEAMMEYDWPGNVRQLENTVEQLVVLNGEHVIEAWEVEEVIGRIPHTHRASQGSAEDGTPLSESTLEELERVTVMKVLSETGWNKAAAARRLGISKTTLWRRLKAWEKRCASSYGGWKGTVS